ncbi:protease B nonderepressible form [Xylographa soralifera]|nr:protease B nonderepressible form [Xylographa soralifera]
MRERITFVHGAEDDFDPSQLEVHNDSLYIKSLKAAREDRITFSIEELPQEIWRVLKQCHELHIRWTSSLPYASVSPFNARVSPGFHLFYTPQRNRPDDLLCPLLQKLFGEDLKCVSPEKTFTALPVTSERFTSSATFQYYQLLPSLQQLVTYIRAKICATLGDTCYTMADSLDSANYVDIDFDAISQVLSISTFRREPLDKIGWAERFNNFGGAVKVEVGVLASEKPTEPEELSLGGFLTIVGEDDKPSRWSGRATRHHKNSMASLSQYGVSFLSPTGLHPMLRLKFASSNTEPPSDNCALHTYLTLPSTLFPDKYQLSSPLFLASKNLRSVRSVSGETDLEAPDWAVEKWGSAMLIELAPRNTESFAAQDSWHADIPLHLRYLRPSESGFASAEIPWPVVFWACTAEEGSKMSVNPFDRVNLGYDGLFGPKTMFYHLDPALNKYSDSDSLVERLSVPVLATVSNTWIEAGTVIVVVTGFLWVLWKLLLVASDRDALTEAKQPGKKKVQ